MNILSSKFLPAKVCIMFALKINYLSLYCSDIEINGNYEKESK